MPGIGIVKIYFQPGADIRTATAQVTSISQTVLKQMPPGVTPPLILNYNASTVPIVQLALSGQRPDRAAAVRSRPEPDPPAAGHRAGRGHALPFGRQAAPDPDRPRSAGAAVEGPVGAGRRQRDRRAEPDQPGRLRQDRRLRSTTSSSTTRRRRSRRSTTCRSRSSTARRSTCATWPTSATASAPQTNVVHVDGSRSVLMTVLKNGATSTLAIVDGVKDKLCPSSQETLPADAQGRCRSATSRCS